MAVICKQMPELKNTHCLFLPEKATPQSDREHVKTLVDRFHLSCQTIEISDLVDSVVHTMDVDIDQLTKANIKARLRMVLLYSYANKTKSLVCGTSNKSELLIGYFTKYGDGGVDIMPLGDIYKTQVFELARYLDIPSEIIKKPPTAGLWKGQTDEKELRLKYEQLDQILYGLECKLSQQKIAQQVSVSIEDVNRIHQLRKSSQHKRRLSLIPKIGLRTPGLDWRVPVQEG
jgi:NAD+ synthase